MIDQFVAWLKTQFPTYTFIQDNFDKRSPNECTLVRSTGGEIAHDHDRRDPTLQFLTRNRDRYECKKQSNTIFEGIINRFHLTIPSVTIGTDVYPSFVAARIVPIQLPGLIGSDDEMRFMYSFNIIVTKTK